MNQVKLHTFIILERNSNFLIHTWKQEFIILKIVLFC